MRLNMNTLIRMLAWVTLLCSWSFVLTACEANPDQGTQGIADRIGVEPSWDAIRKYLIDSLKPGMTKDEIHIVLDQIGPFTIEWSDPPDRKGWDPDTKQFVFRETIRFNDDNTAKALLRWSFLYDRADHLVRFSSIDL